MHILTTLTNLAQSSYVYQEQLFSDPTPIQTAQTVALFLTIAIFVLIIAFSGYIIGSLCLMRIFKKAGVKPWIAWVPFYNNWKTLEIGGQQGFWAVLAIIPVVNIVSAVFMIIALYNIGLKLGKSGAFVLLAIFFSLIWLIWLAVDKSVWNDAAGAPSLTDNVPPTTAATASAAPVASPAYAQPTQPTTFEPTPTYTQPEQPATPASPQAPIAGQSQAEGPNNQQTPPSAY